MSKKYKFHSGCGFEYYKYVEDSSYLVKYALNSEIRFDKFSQAKVFYDSLNCEKAFWSELPIPELIECLVIEDL
jgi:hypothetical protein